MRSQLLGGVALREPIVDECIGCGRVNDGFCGVYELPSRQHRRLGGCAMRTHNRYANPVESGFVDPLKASKKKYKGRS